MTPEERKFVRTILDQRADVLRAYRRSSDAFDRAAASLRETFTAIDAAHTAQDEAILRVIAANEAALGNREGQ